MADASPWSILGRFSAWCAGLGDRIYQSGAVSGPRVNCVVSWFARRGLTPRDTVSLEVLGRRSGKPRTVPVTWAEIDENRYLVSLNGESDWVRNVRAAGGRAVIRRRGRFAVRLQEVVVSERAPVLKAYLDKRAMLRSPAMLARQSFGLEPHPPIEKLETLAERYPVFRIIETTERL
jgi:deazaflavin-dependent oxidoreductase (nitroreductase family)